MPVSCGQKRFRSRSRMEFDSPNLVSGRSLRFDEPHNQLIAKEIDRLVRFNFLLVRARNDRNERLICFVVEEQFMLFRVMSAAFGIPGDGRCLFRSVAYGACMRVGHSSPSESRQKEQADELRERVVEELIKRREDSEWFLEGDFDTYVSHMRRHNAWGGEPELLMSSHVLKMPITVYMRDNSSGNLKIIAEYGQEYGKENPICVLYHGYGHYDALQNTSDSSLFRT
ncbi:hypothetical protein Scep_018136 [Stephania cephalantha]|uniref:Ubiquitin thioesterase OTU n=1 Tax=Stephania cephalantha TaxID=152367 RepID=A0AAP0IQU0_9MAGN